MRTDTAVRKFQIEFAHDFAALSTEELESMAEAGQEVIEVHRVLAKTGDNIVGELLRGHETFFEWTATPSGSDGGRFIVKGGSWDDSGCGICRPAARHGRPAGLKHILIGFRLVAE